MPKAPKPLLRVLFLLPLTVCFLSATACAHAAEIMTNDGQKFDGKILEEESDYVLMEIENGVQVRIDKSQIAYFQREDNKTKPYAQEYPVLGLTYGSPTVLNLVAGYYLADFGLKFSGAYWGGVKGIQVDLSVKLVDDEKFLANFSLVGGAVGTSSADNGYSLWSTGAWGGTDWTYGGIGFDINYGGFVFELDGVTGNFPNPVALPVQIGFVQRFD
ncbi:MAG TPA: hypothetical protein VJ873_07725 [bacterium]|nr:hypothetical protein [bacterium]